MPAGPHAKRRRLLTVHHVVAQGLARLDQAAGNGWQFAAQAGRGGVDNQVDRLVQPVKTACRHRAQVAEQFSQQLGFFNGAVGDSHRGRPFSQQRLQRTPHRTARAQHEDALTLEAETGIDRQVAHQPRTIGVVPQQAAIGQFAQGVDRTCPLRPCGQAVGQAVGVFLERHSHIGATPLQEKLRRAAGKIIQRRQQGVVLHGLAGLFGKQAMQHRGFAVGNRVTKNNVTVHQASSSGSVRRWPTSRGLAGSNPSDALPGYPARLSSRRPSALAVAGT